MAWGLAALLAFLLGLLLYKGARMGLYAWRAYNSGMALLEAARMDASPAALLAHRAELETAAEALDGLRREVQPLAPALRRLNRVTAYGGTLAAAPELLDMAASGSRLAADAAELFAPYLQDNAAGGEALLDGALQALQEQPDAVARLAQEADQVGRALASLEPNQLPPALAGPVAELQPYAAYFGPSLQLAPALPELLGMNRPVTYLLLIQNNHELRATGGFISGVGRFTVERARVTDRVFLDSYDVDDLSKSYPPAPAPLRKYMDAQILLFRDANWSPDLPTTAQTVYQLFVKGQGAEADGIITVDLHALEMILEPLGAITVEGVEEPVTAANVVDAIVQLWDRPPDAEASVGEDIGKWFRERKDFLPLMTEAILNKIRSGRFNYFALAGAARRALDGRAVQIWVHNPQVEEQLLAWGWGGALAPEEGADFVALVDSNVGYNKVDAVLKRSLSYVVQWPDGPDKPAVATATVRYEHTLPKPGHECLLASRYGDSYTEMFERCYFDYVRLYTPRGSQLMGIEGVEEGSVESYRGEAGTQVFAGYFTLKPGAVHEVRFRYRLPAHLTPDNYRVVFQRQAGIQVLPLYWQVEDRAYRMNLSQGVYRWP